MKKIIELSLLLLLVSSVLGKDEVCKHVGWGFEVCTQDGTLKQVKDISHDHSGKYFTLDLRGDTVIGPDVLSNLDLEFLSINLPDRKKEERFSLTLQPDSFSSLPNLQNLSISEANIKFDGGNPLTPLKSLVDLQFRWCNFTEVPTEMLAAVPNLEELAFHANQLIAVRPKDFAPLTRLQRLDLSYNGISSIEPGTFEGLPALRKLDVSFNAFPVVPGLLRGLSQLKTLRISGSLDPNGIPTHLLQEVPLVEDLRVDFNNLTTLSPGMFDGVPSLREVSLYGNKITHVPKGVFENLKSLKEIHLADNKIQTIEPGAFGNLELEDLNFSLNPVPKIIETDTFKGLSVRRLILSQNNITELKPKAFNGLRVTQKVDLTHNNLSEVGAEEFSGLDTKDLDLSQNRIGKIAKDAFKDTVVERLGLFGNPIGGADKAEWGLKESVRIMKSLTSGINDCAKCVM